MRMNRTPNNSDMILITGAQLGTVVLEISFT
jgi:hypothetical protein